MPKQVSKSGLAAKYGSKISSAIVNHANDEVEYDKFGELPGGIRNAIAQLVDCRFDQYKSGDNEGEYYFIAAGVVIEPEFGPDNAPIEGMRTQIMEPVCDTTKRDGTVVTQDEHVAKIINEMKKLGADTSAITDASQLEELAAALKKAAPYFRFSTTTWKANPQSDPRVFHNWNGTKGLEDYAGPSGEDAVEDETGGTEEQEEEEAPAPVTNKGKKPVTSGKKPQPEPEAEEEQDIPYGDELDDLVAAANGTGKAAIDATNELKAKALEAGYSEEEADGADNWEAVAEMIRNPKSDEGEEEEEAVDYVALGKKADKNDKAAVSTLKAAAQAAGIDDDDYGSWEDLGKALMEDSEEGEEESEDNEFVPMEEGVYYWKSPADKKPREYEVASINVKQKTVTLKDTDTQKIVNDPKTKKPMQVAWDDLSEG